MQKGQITFDFIFALVVFLTLAGLLLSFSGDFRESQQKVLAKIESERISADAASAAIYSKILAADSFSYKYKIPPMQASGPSGAYPCTLNASPGTLTVSVIPDEIESAFSSSPQILDNSIRTILDGKSCRETITV